MTVEKRGRTTPEVAAEIARDLGARERDAGTAGLKDKRAVSVQRISVLSKATPEEALRLQGRGFRVLAAARHGNKLRPGHLRGNRFRIVVRGVVPEGIARARAICARLAEIGVANLFGPQRFGKYGDNAELGRAILLGERPIRDRFLRIADGLFATAIDGDVLKKRATGGLFVCEDPRADAPRVFSGELDPAGPLPGHSLFASRGEAARREQAVLAETHIDPRSFASAGEEMQGARRPYRIAPNDLRVEPAGDDALVVSFALPKGSYAVSVLREISKNDVEEADSSA